MKAVDDHSIDLWSIGTCLYELFTGHVLFTGRTNNDMLRLMMAVKGRFPNKLLRAHFRAYENLNLDPHFDADLKFKQWDIDPVSGKPLMKLVDIAAPAINLSTTLLSAKAGSDDRRLVVQLADLLDKSLSLDPSKRIGVLDALRHPFFTTK